MTTKELAEDLKEHIGCGIEVPLYDEELEVVVEALEKQIAKKMDSFNCPICRYYFEDGEIHNYCPNCGQKIDLERGRIDDL